MANNIWEYGITTKLLESAALYKKQMSQEIQQMDGEKIKGHKMTEKSTPNLIPIFLNQRYVQLIF